MNSDTVKAEAFKVVDVITLTTASISLIIVALTLLLIIYIYYKVREDVRLMDELVKRTDLLSQKFDEGYYVSDQITNVIYDLFRLIAAVKGFCELTREGLPVQDLLFDKMRDDIIILEKHFAELGLLSVDLERRRSAQQSLANFSGDWDSLSAMQDIFDRKIGIADSELPVAIAQLKQRLLRAVQSSRWTGRPSGGAF